MRILRWIGLLAALLATTASARSPAAGIEYAVTPQWTDGKLTSLLVELRMQGGPAGTEILSLPDEGDPAHPLIVDMKAHNAKLTPAGEGHSVLTYRANAPVSVSYRVLSGVTDDPATQPRNPVIRPTWFAVHGERAFMVPESRGHSPARVTFGGFPKGWTAASSLTGPTPIDKVRDSLLLGGRHYRVVSRTVLGKPLRMAFPERLAGAAGPMLDQITRVMKAEHAFWRAPGEPFFVGLVPVTDDADFSGRGLQDGFALYLGSHAPRDQWLHLVAHEHLHSWISRRIGGFPDKDPDLEAWLNEGFTEAYAARILLDSGLWSLDRFVEDQNTALLNYGASPVRTAPNSRILADRSRDWDVGKLPYDRGRLLALLWDHELRVKTEGRAGLDAVLRAQIGEAAQGGGLSADRLFPVVVRRTTGLDLSGEITRFVDEGAAIELPGDLFGPCARIEAVSQPVFDRGFDFGATIRAHGRLSGLEPGGPAERAGLHEGDKLLIDELPSRNSQVSLIYRVVEADGRRREVRYKPEGASLISFQQIRLTPLARRDPRGCARAMARP